MRNTEMRTLAVHSRLAQLRRARQRRRMIWITGTSAALCLILIVALSLAMPAISAQTVQSAADGAAASIFARHASLSFVVIGILGFLLGVALTLLCLVLRRRDLERGHD